MSELLGVCGVGWIAESTSTAAFLKIETPFVNDLSWLDSCSGLKHHWFVFRKWDGLQDLFGAIVTDELEANSISDV